MRGEFPNRVRDWECALAGKPAEKLQDPARVATIFSEALSPLRKFEIDSIANVLEVAIRRHLTFYDATYVHLAEKESLKLVTADIDLLKKCKAAISINEMK